MAYELLSLNNGLSFLKDFASFYINNANKTIKQLSRYLFNYFSLDYVLTHFFMPYKKVDNIAGWFVGVGFKIIYLVFVLPIYLLSILGLIVFYYAFIFILLGLFIIKV